MSSGRLAGALAAVLLVAGCQGPRFEVHGTVNSDATGPAYKDAAWSARPEGCTRDRFDEPAEPTRSVATLVWQPPSAHDPLRNGIAVTPDAPLRLELSRAEDGSGLEATLHTQRHAGVRLNAKVCERFHASTWEEPVAKGAEPTLAGELGFDCRSAAGHFTAALRFSHCAY